MPLTRSFKEFVKSRIERDPKFRQAMFQEAVQTLIEGDVDTAKAVLRDFINAAIGFPALAEATKRITDEPDFSARIAELGAEAAAGTTPEARAYIRNESIKWQGVIAKTGAKLD